MFKNIHLASMSQVKLAAVVKFFESHNVKQFSPGETFCPQPVSYDNAIRCLNLRMSITGFNEELAFKKDLYLAIENYIEEDNRIWYDECAVMATYFRNGYWNSVFVKSPVKYAVPVEFAPTGPPDLPLGYSQTVGSKIHAAYPEIPEDDWSYKFHDHDRVYQIVQALKRLNFPKRKTQYVKFEWNMQDQNCAEYYSAQVGFIVCHKNNKLFKNMIKCLMHLNDNHDYILINAIKNALKTKTIISRKEYKTVKKLFGKVYIVTGSIYDGGPQPTRMKLSAFIKNLDETVKNHMT